MSNIILAKAGDNYHILLAKYYHNKRISRDEVLTSLKASNYTVTLNKQTVKFNAISVMGIMQGLEISSSYKTLDLEEVNSKLESGELKYTKAKLIHIPKETACQQN